MIAPVPERNVIQGSLVPRRASPTKTPIRS
jgi:hypothetical protein